MAGIRLEQVGKRYDNGVVAVRDLTFDVADGEFVVLVGPLAVLYGAESRVDDPRNGWPTRRR